METFKLVKYIPGEWYLHNGLIFSRNTPCFVSANANFNQFVPNGTFLYLLKTYDPDVFRG